VAAAPASQVRGDPARAKLAAVAARVIDAVCVEAGGAEADVRADRRDAVDELE
jgi:hypothetical protein